MLFPTATFALFFLVVMPLSWLTMPRPRLWRPLIVLASFVFYAWWDWRFVFLLGGCIVWNQAFAVRIHDAAGRRRTTLLVVALAGNLGVLGYFKYSEFGVASTANLASLVGLDLPVGVQSVVLPVGISFYTFMGISYLVDVHRRQTEPTSLAKAAVYLSFFPHLVAGPIVRPSELLPQLETPRDHRSLDTSRAFYLIATGLFKKVVIANYLASEIVDPVFAAPASHSSAEMTLAVYAYAVQIYADFSGYTDIAIGIALLLGFRFPQNFDAPYTAASLQDFWHRWHMTLSRWLRDYVYIPLGGNRGGRLATYRNLMLTMLIGGLWHGAGWTFVVWGGIHGIGLAVERFVGERRGLEPREPSRLRLAGQRVLTFHLVCLAWIFFRASTFGDAWAVVVGLFTRWDGAAPLVSAGVVLAVLVGLGTQYLPQRLPAALMRRFACLPVAAQAVVLAITLTVINALGPEGVAPFIYFRF
jgi:alginate O-acetyltransferase complex protein AlgI